MRDPIKADRMKSQLHLPALLVLKLSNLFHEFFHEPYKKIGVSSELPSNFIFDINSNLFLSLKFALFSQLCFTQLHL